MKPHRVLHLLSTSRLENTAVANMVAEIAGGLDPSEFSIHARFLGSPGPLADRLRPVCADVRVVDTRKPDLPAIWRTVREAGSKHFSLIHVHLGGRSIRWMRRIRARVPVIAHLHSAISEGPAPSPLQQLNAGDAEVIAVSGALAAAAAPRKVEVVYPGVRVPELQQPRAWSGLPVIGTACRLEPVKGVRILIQAVARLAAGFPGIRLEIAGSGREESELKALVASMGLSACVSFLGWQGDLDPCFKKWDVFAMPSLAEGFGIAALQAMASGLPVVASRTGGLPELVLEGATGTLVPAGDVEALAEAMASLVRNPEQSLAMGARGRQRVAESFTVQQMVRSIERIYREVLSAQASSE